MLKLNSCLKQYRKARFGEPAIIYCCGPSLNDFDRSKIKGKTANIVMKMGILATDKYDKMDYYFFGDKNDKSKPYEHLISGLTCPKFGLVYTNWKPDNVKTYDAAFCESVGANALNISYRHGFQKNIARFPLYRCSTIFPCLQFTLFLGCSPIYVVGMDLTQEESFKNPVENRGKIFLEKMYSHLERFKEFRHQAYPKSEVIRVNPVVGKGLLDRDLIL